MDDARSTELSDRHRDIEQIAAAWLARRDGGIWARDDDEALTRWMDADFAHRVAFLRLQACWQESGRLQALGAGWRSDGPPPRGYWRASPETRRDQLLQALSGKKFHSATGRRDGAGARIAFAGMAALCMLAAGWGWRTYSRVDIASYLAAPGEVSEVTLADGSHAMLASGSSIDTRFSHRWRRVALERGEAIFDVAKDASRPFVVAAKGRHVVAVGTRFSVRHDDHALRVVVTEGMVRLETPAGAGDPQPVTVLPAGSVAVVQDNRLMLRTVALADAERLLEWRNGLLEFRDATLAQAAAEFNRHNVRQLVIADASAGALPISGTFRWDNEEGFVRLLEAGFPVRAEIGEQQIVLHSH